MPGVIIGAGSEDVTYCVDEERGNAFLGLIQIESRNSKKRSNELANTFIDLARKSNYDFFGLKVENHDEGLSSLASVTNSVEFALNLQESIGIQRTCTDLPEVKIKIGISAGVPMNWDLQVLPISKKASKKDSIFFLQNLSRTFFE